MIASSSKIPPSNQKSFQVTRLPSSERELGQVKMQTSAGLLSNKKSKVPSGESKMFIKRPNLRYAVDHPRDTNREVPRYLAYQEQSPRFARHV